MFISWLRRMESVAIFRPSVYAGVLTTGRFDQMEYKRVGEARALSHTSLSAH